MDLTQLFSLAGYTTLLCFFFYRLNEKTVREWREEHTQQLRENEVHWREMFKYMSERIDNQKP
jgi:hypothetical protein